MGIMIDVDGLKKLMSRWRWFDQMNSMMDVLFNDIPSLVIDVSFMVFERIRLTCYQYYIELVRL
jgi:hypothetical protein